MQSYDRSTELISIHALCEEGDIRHDHTYQQGLISIHALCEEGDPSRCHSQKLFCDFYPRPLRGGRRYNADSKGGIEIFLSTPSARRATMICPLSSSSMIFLSTPSARRATSYPPDREQVSQISIHALCEEGDVYTITSSNKRPYFYPRPLRGGRQQKQRQNLYFQTNYTTFCTNLEEP